MPKGVEHTNPDDLLTVDEVAVRTAVMPKGVEHSPSDPTPQNCRT